MCAKKEKKSTQIVAIISVAASIVAIITFVFGKSSIPEIFNPKSSESKELSISISHSGEGDIYTHTGEGDVIVNNYSHGSESSASSEAPDHELKVALEYQASGDNSKALEYFNKALESQIALNGLDHIDTAITRYHLALHLMNNQAYEQAIDNFNKCVNPFKKTYGETSIHMAQLYTNTAYCYEMLNKRIALDIYQKSLDIFNDSALINPEFIDTAYETARINIHMADIHYKDMNFKSAYDLYQKAYVFFESNDKDIADYIKIKLSEIDNLIKKD